MIVRIYPADPLLPMSIQQIHEIYKYLGKQMEEHKIALSDPLRVPPMSKRATEMYISSHTRKFREDTYSLELAFRKLDKEIARRNKLVGVL